MDDLKIHNRFLLVKKSNTFNNVLDIHDLRNKKVLDLGCGYGEYMDCFADGSVGITTTIKEVEYGKRKKLNIKKAM
jgi:cyclopropane fatty-acyl-phospholipid synthase-like methyltransferase